MDYYQDCLFSYISHRLLNLDHHQLEEV